MKNFVFNGDWETELELNRLTKLDNPVFFEGEYSQKVKKRLNNDIVELTIEDRYDNNPDPAIEQFNAIDFIQKHEDLLIDKIFDKVKNDVYPFMKTMIDDDVYNFPLLNTVQDLKNAIGLLSIQISREAKDNYAYFVINFYCTWDNEHGFCVLFHKDRILDWSALWDYDLNKICLDCGIDYEQNIYNYNHWDDGVYDFIEPNSKYGKLKPLEYLSNQSLPFRLIRVGKSDVLIEHIKAGKIDINFGFTKGTSSNSLLRNAISFKEVDLVEFLLQSGIKNFLDSFSAASKCGDIKIKKMVEVYYEKNKSQLWLSPF